MDFEFIWTFEFLALGRNPGPARLTHCRHALGDKCGDSPYGDRRGVMSRVAGPLRSAAAAGARREHLLNRPFGGNRKLDSFENLVFFSGKERNDRNTSHRYLQKESSWLLFSWVLNWKALLK